MSTVEELDLYNNAIDSLKHGLAHYIEYEEQESISDIKQAIMNLVNAIDLFILEKVRRTKGDNSIYETDKMDRFGLGYRQTIRADKAYKLIKNDVDEISDDELKAYEILKILRNSATHSSFSFGEDSEKNIVFLLHYIARFLDNELDEDIADLLDDYEFKFYHQKIIGLDYGEVLQERIYAAIESEIAWMNFRSIKDGGTPVVAEWSCHECNREGISLDEELGPYGECVFCGHKHRIAQCVVCETIFDPDWEGFFDEEEDFALCEYHSDLENMD
ncbi:hypothetical protein C0966_17490 (plasmid) [Bacillus methanolicus]|uniref:hypothetical protein n=1 Tax=Bacillus methanolicus TaxID=1471 RepID=UPI002380758E|nr:hypothetical protein [Bacillus methanolicus]MDE3841058.1 hypothetical protein [Bacillus methanolicus]